MSDTAKTASFVHLHTHTEFSMLDGLGKVDEMCAAAARDGQSAVAMTDHGRLNGAWRFRSAAKKHGLKPIYGVEAYLAIGSRHEQNTREEERDEGDYGDFDEEQRGKKQSSTKTVRYEHLTILARNETGWKNLVMMQNKAQQSYWYHPRIDYDLLKEHGEGLIVLSGCLAGPVAGRLKHGLIDEAKDNLRRLIDCVGRENVYVEIMEHNIGIEAKVLRDLVDIAQGWTDENGNPDPLDLVVTNDAHYVDCDHAGAHDAWLAVQSKSKVADKGRFAFNGEGYHLRTEAEMRSLHDEDWWQTACDNTVKIAERCDANTLESPGRLLPEFPVPEGFESSTKFFHHLLAVGAKERYGLDPETGKLPEQVRERLNFEYRIIVDAGVPDYFLIVSDLIDWANSDLGLPEDGFERGRPGGKKPIITGPGRGSAAGSICAYVLGITDLCPLENNLLFERFLEPGRAELPDIDLDFEALRRAEVLEYLALRWGRESVSRIGSFASSKSRAAIGNAGRVHELSTEANRLKKLIPVKGGNPIGLADMFNENNPVGKDFRELATQLATTDLNTMLDHARVWEGAVSGEGVHACGILVAPRTLTDFIPLRYDRAKSAATDADGNPTTLISLWDSRDVEDFGLLKLDVLSLDNLDFMAAAFDFIEMTQGKTLTIKDIPHPATDDESVRKTWALLQAGRTAGVFQLDSDGMTGLVKDMQVSSFEDLSAAVAIYRPGPLSAGLNERYVERKHGREPVDYGIFTQDPEEQRLIATVLDETFGVPIYQEQLMRLGGVMAGFDAPSRSRLRKAVAKKDKDVMAEVGERFITECQQAQYDDNGDLVSPTFAESTAVTMWETFKGSADYLFNKSHSAAYGLVSYMTAWLKANYPVEYGAAILTVTKKADKRLLTMRDLEAAGVEVLQPDVNYSLSGTAPEIGDDGKPTGRIRFGLSEIKGVGDSGAHVARERLEGGRFGSLKDMIERVRIVDASGTTAPKKLSVSAIEGLIEAGALDSFGPRLGLLRVSRALPAGLDVPAGELPPVFRSMLQRERLGIAVGPHPLTLVKDYLADYVIPQHTDKYDNVILGKKPQAVRPDMEQGAVFLLGVLSAWEVVTRPGGRFASFTLEGTRGSLDGAVWYDAFSDMVRSGRRMPRAGDVVALSGYLKVTETVLETEASDEELDTGDVVTVAETLTVRKLSANKIWAVSIPFTPERYPANTFGGTTPLPPASFGSDLAALSALSNQPVSSGTPTLPLEPFGGADGPSGGVATLEKPITAPIMTKPDDTDAPDVQISPPEPPESPPASQKPASSPARTSQVSTRSRAAVVDSRGTVLFSIRDERHKFRDMVGIDLMDPVGREVMEKYGKPAPPKRPKAYILSNTKTSDIVIFVNAHDHDHDDLVAKMESFHAAGHVIDPLDFTSGSGQSHETNGVTWTIRDVDESAILALLD